MSAHVKLALSGDVCPGEHYFNLGHGVLAIGSRRGFSYLFGAIRHLFLNADIGFANLEGVLSTSGRMDTDIETLVFRGVPSVAEAMAAAGIRVVSIANNHVLQQGIEAFFDTLAILKGQGIQPCGERSTSPFSSRRTIVQTPGAVVAFLGYSAVPEEHFRGDLPYAQFRLDDALSDITEARLFADFVVASVHIGVDGSGRLPEADRLALRQLAVRGADVVAAHHSHVFQRVERVNTSVVCQNLGDLVFDLHWHRAHRPTAVVQVVLDRSLPSAHVQISPLFIGNDFAPRPVIADCERTQFTARVLDIEELTLEEPARLGWLLAARKLWYFCVRLPHGATRLKFQFLLRKLRTVLRAVWTLG